MVECFIFLYILLLYRLTVHLCISPAKPSITAKVIKIPLHIIKIEDKDASKLYEFNFILVRPDLMVAWRSNLLPDNPRTVLEKISGI